MELTKEQQVNLIKKNLQRFLKKKEFVFDEFEIGELEKEWKQGLRNYNLRELVKIFPEARAYLKSKLNEKKKEAEKLEKEVKEGLEIARRGDKNSFLTFFRKQIVKDFIGEDLDNLIAGIRNLKFALAKKLKRAGRIGETEIEIARSYPLEHLIEFKGGWAKCPFHNESRASFHKIPNTNLGYCFGCNWQGDPIKFLQDRDKLSFIEAVNYLIKGR